MYKYFVSYTYHTNDGYGYGSMQVEIEYKISDIKDIIEIQKEIAKENKFDSVIILNYILF